MQKVKDYLINLKNEFSFNEKGNFFLFIRCLGIVLLQILSFLVRPLIFAELVYVLILVIFDKKKENKLAYLFFLLPFYNVFRYGTSFVDFSSVLDNFKNMYFSIWILLAFDIILFIEYIIKAVRKQIKIDVKSLCVWLALFLVFVLPLKKGMSFEISNLVVITALFVTVYLIIAFEEEFNFHKLLNFWFFGAVFSVLIYLMKSCLPAINEYLIVFENNRFTSLLKDPNYWSLEVLFLLGCFTVLFFKKESLYSFPICFIVLTVVGIITESKAFFLSYLVYFIFLVIALIITYIKNKYNLKKYNKIIWVCISVFVVFVLMTILLLKGRLTSLFGRLVSFNTASGANGILDKLTTNRWSIWVVYIKEIFQSAFNVLLGRSVIYGYAYQAVHNTPLQLFYFGGIVGIVFLIIGLVIVLKKRKFSIKIWQMLPLLSIALMTCSLDLLFSFRTSFMLVLLFGIITKEKEKQHE